MMITWTNRYSDTMEDDKFGRWARIAYVGTGIDCVELAWIRKIPAYRFNKKVQEDLKGLDFIFVVEFNFPRKGKITFTTLDEAKEQVRIDLEHFKTLLK